MKIDTTHLNPLTLNDFVFSKSFVKALLEDIIDGALTFPAMGKTGICLHGIYGTGKTTLALRLPELLDHRQILGKPNRSDVLVRDPIYDLTKCKPGNDSIQQANDIAERVDSRMSFSNSGWHFEVLDEVDLLTEKAQDTLKSMMTFNKDTIFIMTTNHPSKLNKGIVDRCHMIEMSAASAQDLVGLGKIWLTKIGLSDEFISEAELFEIAAHSNGSIREFGTGVIRTAARR
jgi:DNA polymerase III delta prime subunit